jgi:WYL_2, Sm-like SH3 beta-barrel fold
MGTRSLTFFYQDGKPFCAFYRQMDGYPSGHGVDLGEILAPITLVNGYQLNMQAGEYANGPGCLAAQVIQKLKTGIGSIYMITPNPKDHENGWQEYEYHVHCNAIGEDYTARYITSIKVTDTKNTIFSGSWKEFLAWAQDAKLDSDGNYIPVILPVARPPVPKKVKEDLRTALRTETVEVIFDKADGSRRVMRCTLNPELIPEEKMPAGDNATLRRDPHLYKVFDLDKQDWRSFREERLVQYEVL